mmetsp:Transcript_125868/g.361957  ORF Transcript_125868/g.361957 Transcript_125868/m.361957 type:complete len:292 (-) Transcript_125868:1627-2502(-)
MDDATAAGVIIAVAGPVHDVNHRIAANAAGQRCNCGARAAARRGIAFRARALLNADLRCRLQCRLLDAGLHRRTFNVGVHCRLLDAGLRCHVLNAGLTCRLFNAGLVALRWLPRRLNLNLRHLAATLRHGPFRRTSPVEPLYQASEEPDLILRPGQLTLHVPGARAAVVTLVAVQQAGEELELRLRPLQLTTGVLLHAIEPLDAAVAAGAGGLRLLGRQVLQHNLLRLVDPLGQLLPQLLPLRPNAAPDRRYLGVGVVLLATPSAVGPHPPPFFARAPAAAAATASRQAFP